MALPLPHRLLATALLALLALYLGWFHDDRQRTVAWLVFALPPLLLAIGVLRGNGKAVFWSAVLALAWFSHGVMVAWSRPGERGLAWIEIALALVVIACSSIRGLRARLGRRGSG